MTKNLTESMFESKLNLGNFYPKLPGIKNFDLEREHLFYGRIDPDGDVVYLEDSNLKQIYSGKKQTHFAADFVSEAFSDFRQNVKKASDKNFLNRSGVFPTNLKAYKAWDHRDLEYNYNQYINKIYVDFVNNYLEKDRRHEKIKDHKTFIKEFLNYAIAAAYNFPITKTGFIVSRHCSPFVSGLMFEIAGQNHGIATNTMVMKYVNDPNFLFIVNEAKKFGFMVDKNAPWRLVFNLASGWTGSAPLPGKAAGAQRFMERFGVNYENVFKFYYRKAYLAEMVNIANLFYSLYDSFYKQYGTYEVAAYTKCTKNRDSYNLRVISTRKPRDFPQDMSGEEHYEYWLKIILKLRLKETRRAHTPSNFRFFADEMLDNKRTLGAAAALKYINDLTKGFFVPNFVQRGTFWNGFEEQEYQQGRKKAIELAINPDLVRTALIGTKNIIK